MSRTVIQLNCSNPQDSEIVIQKILSAHDYRRKDKNGEIFYQNGVGFLVAPKFIKYTFNGEVLTLEGWVKPFAFQVNLNFPVLSVLCLKNHAKRSWMKFRQTLMHQ